MAAAQKFTGEDPAALERAGLQGRAVQSWLVQQVAEKKQRALEEADERERFAQYEAFVAESRGDLEVEEEDARRELRRTLAAANLVGVAATSAQCASVTFAERFIANTFGALAIYATDISGDLCGNQSFEAAPFRGEPMLFRRHFLDARRGEAERIRLVQAGAESVTTRPM